MGGTCAVGACACRSGAAGQGNDGAAVLVRVTVGAIPRDTSTEEGQVIRLDRDTARALVASGQASPVRPSLGAGRVS
jgi:hypothetical protein